MPGDPLYQKPVRRNSGIDKIREKFKSSKGFSSSSFSFPKRTPTKRSLSTPNLQSLVNSASDEKTPSEVTIPSPEQAKIIPGMYPPHIEATILSKMKNIAMAKSAQGMWVESYRIFKTILDCQEVTLGYNHYQVANTLYYIGNALNKLNDPDAALLEFSRGVQILYPHRFQYKNIYLASLFYEMAVIYGTREDYDQALHYLDLSKQVEEYVLGIPLEKTCHMITVYEYKKASGTKQSFKALNCSYHNND